MEGHLGRFPFSQKFRKFRFGAKWKTFFRFARLENSQKKWNCLESKPFISLRYKKISVRTHILPTSTFYILHPYKQPTEHGPLTGQEEICFLNSEMPEKVTLVQVQINQNNLVLPTKLKMRIWHRKEIQKPTFRALTLRRSESKGLTLEMSASESLYGG